MQPNKPFPPGVSRADLFGPASAVRELDTLVTERQLAEVSWELFAHAVMVDSSGAPPRHLELPHKQLASGRRALLANSRKRLVISVASVDDVTARRVFIALTSSTA